MHWLLEKQAQAQMDLIMKSGLDLKAFNERGFDSEAGEAILAVVGGIGQINIRGILTQKPDFFARVFDDGNTTYGQIIDALASAQANEDVKEVILMVDSSPGGTVAGLWDAMAAVQNFSKPIKAVVQNMASSATYGLISQADSIEAANPLALFGSIGIVIEMFVSDNEVKIASRNAPNKRPDVKTAAGVAAVQDELDPVAAVFDDAIALGRRTTVANINANFGQGATLVAKAALDAGMIDTVARVSLKSVDNTRGTPAASSGSHKKLEAKTDMDLATIKAEHAGLYAQILAEGVQEGTKIERDRVTSHLIYGKSHGAMDTAIKAVGEGAEMTATYQALYAAAGLNKHDLSAQDADEKAVALAADKAKGASTAEDEKEKTLTAKSHDAFYDIMGIDPPKPKIVA